MILEIDLDDRTPPYQQIKGQISALIATGELSEGTRLPPVRQLASDLDLAPNTVARAYRKLEQDGLLVTRGRRGTFVAGPLPPPPSDAAAGRPDGAQLDGDQLDAAAQPFAALARRLGIDRRTAILPVNQALAALPADRAG